MNKLSVNYLEELNDIQRQAVTNIDGPVMVIAGPGSGKTRVLTYRIAHIINQGIAPWQILALTFTNKAAREMKERIETVVGSVANRVWAGTFHSLFAKILRVEAHLLGYPNDFTIYDTTDSKSLVSSIIKGMNLNTKAYPVGAIRARISNAKCNLITPKMYAVNEDMLAMDRMNRQPMLYQIYEAYDLKCKRAGAMDFDDLLLQMFRLLYQNPDNVRLKYQKQFQYLMVDEFQDTNFLQYEILKLLSIYPDSNNNICIVGDDAQSIYSFRGATIENILQFKNDFPEVQVFKLEQNYRSTKYIVEAANSIIGNNSKQIQKKIWTAKEDGNKIKLIKTMTETEEGKRVADSIIEQKNRFGLANKQIAILYRTNAQSRVFEEQLRRHNITYKVYGGLSFYQRKEIKDVLAYMRLVVNQNDDEAFKRVINYPKRGIGATTMGQLQQLADDNEMSLWQCVTSIEFNSRSKKSILSFIELIRKFKQKSLEDNAYETGLYIAKATKIIGLLKAENTIEAQGRLENINALLDGIQEFVEDDVLDEGENLNEQDRSISSFLQTISLMTDQDNDTEETDFVTLMSVHAAKGLEYQSVFVVGLEENLFPSYMSLSDPNQLDEERRLFYVAITRAEKVLTLSHANSRYQYGQTRFNDVSRFIGEIPDEHFEMKITSSGKSGLREPILVGNFKPLRKKQTLSPAINPSDFKPNSSSEIKEGMKVLHLKFGKGTVKNIDERNVATIVFDHVTDHAEKRIMLQYAKLQILAE